MSNQNPDARYHHLTQALAFVLEQRLKDVHTVMPGIVQDFDGTTRRASIQPALDMVLTDGRGTVPRPRLVDVPVVTHAGGGFIVAVPLRAGDAVLVAFSERGIARFKETFERAVPEAAELHALADAVALPGFGPVDAIAVVDPAGVAVQSEDGEQHVMVKAGEVAVKAAAIRLDGNVSVTGTLDVAGNATLDGNLDVDGGELNHSGTNVGRTHRHTEVMAGGAVSGPPQP